MQPGIYVGSKLVPKAIRNLGNLDSTSNRAYQHLYLVYRDGNGLETVIRGGPDPDFIQSNLSQGALGAIRLEYGIPLANSLDAYRLVDNETATTRNERLIVGGNQAAAVWNRMLTTAGEISDRIIASEVGGRQSIAPYDFKDKTQNSNSVVAAVLASNGFTVDKALPNGVSIGQLPGATNLLAQVLPDNQAAQSLLSSRFQLKDNFDLDKTKTYPDDYLNELTFTLKNSTYSGEPFVLSTGGALTNGHLYFINPSTGNWARIDRSVNQCRARVDGETFDLSAQDCAFFARDLSTGKPALFLRKNSNSPYRRVADFDDDISVINSPDDGEDSLAVDFSFATDGAGAFAYFSTADKNLIPANTVIASPVSTSSQTDDDGNILELTTNANGSGTSRSLDPDGHVINQYTFQRTNDGGVGAIDGENGIISGTVNGQAAVFAADFGYIADEGTTVSIRAIQSIGGQSVSAFNNALDPMDLEAYGFTWQNITTGSLPSTATALLSGLDPSSLSTTGWPSPTVLETVLPSGVVSRSIELPGITLTNLRNSSGELLSTVSQTDLGFNENAIRIYSPDGDLLQVGKRSFDVVTGGYTETLRNELTGQIIINSATGPNSGSGSSSDGADAGGSGGVITTVPLSGTGYGGSSGASTWTSTLSNAARAANDFLGFASAIQAGRPLPILSSGLRVASSTIDPGNTALNTASSIVGGVSSLLNLGNALESGDTIGTIYAGSQLYGTGLSLYAQSTTFGLSPFDIDAISEVGDAFAAADSFNGGVLPYVGIFTSLAKGDPVGAAVSYIAMTYPVVGWIYGALQILSSLFSSPPEPWGQGSLVWASQEVIDGYIEQVGYSGSGDNIGEAYSVSVPNSKTVIDLSTTELVIKYAAGDGGDATISNVLSGFKANTQALLAQTQARTATPLGLIAERLPSARYHVYEQYYESHSTPRRFYAGYLPKPLIKQAGNDDAWRVAA